MKRDKKADPNDYPLLAYRVSQDEKDELSAEIKAVMDIYNKGMDEKIERRFLRNDIFVEALRIGLAALRKRKKG